MTRIIAVALAKGGVGKTTTAVNLAAALAHAGRRVLLVDTDTQNQAARSLGILPEKGLYDYVADKADAAEVLAEARPNLYLLAGGQSIARLKRQFSQAEYGVEGQLAASLAPLSEFFNYILIDNSPGWDTLAVNVLFYAQEALCPVTLETLAIQGLFDYTERISRIGKDSGIELRYIVPTMQDRRFAQTEEIHVQLREHYGPLLCDPIRANIRLSEAPAHGEHIFEYAPTSRGADDYMRLALRVMQDEQA